MRTETASRPSDNATVAPIFIIASARSGSTLLRFLLDSHPSIACPPETNLVEACAALCNVARVLSTDCGSSPLGAQGIEQARTAIESLLGEYSRSRGKIRWCDKSLVSVLHADILGSIWPCAQFLCLYRHCMDVVYSGIQASPWGLHGMAL